MPGASNSNDGFLAPPSRSGFPVGMKRATDTRRTNSDDDDDEEEVDPQVAAALSAALFSDLTAHQQQQAAAAASADGGDAPADAAGAGDTVKAGVEALKALAEPPQARRKDCVICEAPAKYTCPRCNARTCSLTCVKKHKVEASCSGIVDAAAPVPLNEFTDKHLARDYHFMQDMDRVVSNAHRGLDRHWRYDIRALPPPLHALREAAKKRGVLCQITSEGMSKRDRNTSRFDRRRDAIIWHVEFDVRGVVKSRNFRVESHWGNERFRLGDLFAAAWQTNPALLCFHIRRGYNRASSWVEKGTASAGANATAEASPTEAAEPTAEGAEGGTPTESKAPAAPTDISGIPSAVVSTGEKDVHREEEQGTPNAGVTVSDSDDDDANDGNKANAAGSSGKAPTTPRSMTAKANIDRYLSEAPNMAEDLLFLVKAERLGTVEAYFRLNPNATIHDNLRHVFFVNEYPTVIVARAEDAANYPIVTEAQRVAIRETFRPKHHPNDRARPMHHQQQQQQQGDDSQQAASPGEAGVDGAAPAPRLDFDNLSDEQKDRLRRVPCRQYSRFSKCDRGDACPFWHCEPSELPACRSMVQMGQCPLGPRCSFSHDEAVVRRTREDPEFRRVRRGPDGGDDAHGDRPTSLRGGRGRGRGRGRGGPGGAYLRGYSGQAPPAAPPPQRPAIHIPLDPHAAAGMGASPGQQHQHAAAGAHQPSHHHHHHHHQQHSDPRWSERQQHRHDAESSVYPPGYAAYMPPPSHSQQQQHHAPPQWHPPQ